MLKCPQRGGRWIWKKWFLPIRDVISSIQIIHEEYAHCPTFSLYELRKLFCANILKEFE